MCQPNSSPYADSLRQVIAGPVRDTNHLSAVFLLARDDFNRGDYHAALAGCREALLLAKDLHAEKKIPLILYHISLNFINLNQYDSGKFYLDKCEQLVSKTNDIELLIQCTNSNGLLCSYQNDFSGSIEYYLKNAVLLEKPEAAAFKGLIPQNLGNIGHSMIAENQLEKGIAYEKKALTYHNYPNELRYTIIIHLDIFATYCKLNDIVKAKQHLDTAIVFDKKLNNIQVTALVMNNEGYYYEMIKDYKRSLSAQLFALHIFDSTQNLYMKALARQDISELYIKLKNTSSAQHFALEANNLAKELSAYEIVAITYKVLETIAAGKGDYKNALVYADLNKLYADSATNASTQKTTLSLESKYQNQKKEKEILGLKAANAESELVIVKRNRLLLIGGIGASSLLLILGLFYRNSRHRHTIAEKEQILQREQIKFLKEQQQVVSLQSMINGQETERTRIAKDLHDGLGGLFSTVKMHFSTLQHDVPGLKENQLFSKSYELVDNASVEVRRIAHNMMPEVLLKLGLLDGLEDMCANINAGKLLNISLQAYGMEKRLNASAEIMLYRIIQELLNNIIKHSQASEAIVQFNRDGRRLHVTVEDNGRGFNTKEADEKTHAGLGTVQSRVNYLNGSLSIESQQGLGTTVMMDFLISDE